MSGDLVYWPFPVIKAEAEWTEFDRDFIDFMTAASREGFGPRMDLTGNPEAGNPSLRWAFLCRRGSRNGWEPFLAEEGKGVRLGPSFGFGESRCVVVRPPFRAAAYLALEWLRGRPLEAVLADFVFLGGHPSAIELSPEAAIPSVVVGGDQAPWDRRSAP